MAQRRQAEQAAKDRLQAELRQVDEDLARTEREANEKRSQAEGHATERYQSERIAADAELATVRQETDAWFQRTEAETSAHYQAERQATDKALTQAQHAAEEHLNAQEAEISANLEVRRREIAAARDKAHDEATAHVDKAEMALEYPRTALTAVSLGGRLPKIVEDRDVALDEGASQVPARALVESSAAAQQAARAVESAARDLEQSRDRRDKRAALAFLAVAVAMVFGYFYSQWRDEQEWRARLANEALMAPIRTAEAQLRQTVEAQATAEAQATTEAQAQQTTEAQAQQTAEAQAQQTVEAQVTAEAQVQVQATAEAFADELAVLEERFDLRFVHVPAGEFKMGGEGLGVYTIYLDTYWIGLTEVTVGQYARFVQAGGYYDKIWWTEAGWKYVKALGIEWPRCQEGSPSNFPQACVSWYEAIAYSNWLAHESGLEIRLPTEAEWEKAARGTDGRIYPWGNTIPADQGSSFGNIERGSEVAWRRVGQYPSGASPYGALDMIGNVWEWTSSKFNGYPYRAEDGRENVEGDANRVGRGGSWLSVPESATVFVRDSVPPRHDGTDVGFRLVVVPH